MIMIMIMILIMILILIMIRIPIRSGGALPKRLRRNPPKKRRISFPRIPNDLTGKSRKNSAKNGRNNLIQKIVKTANKANIQLENEKIYKKGQAKDTNGLSEGAKKYLDAFISSLENDLLTPVALSQISKILKDNSIEPKETIEVINRMDSVLGLKLVDEAKKVQELSQKQNQNELNNNLSDPEAQEIQALLDERKKAKSEKNFSRADEIRKILSDRGITIIDTPQGTTWKRN